MDKIVELYKNFKYKWIIIFILFFPFMKISYLRTVTILLPVYSVFRWMLAGIIIVCFFFIKKAKPSKLFYGFLALEGWILLITILNNRDIFGCLKDALSIITVGLFIELFKDEPKDLLNALMLNFEIAIYPNLYTIVTSLDTEKFRDVVQYLGYFNLLILYVFPAILIAALYMKENKKYIRGSILIVTSIAEVVMSKASTPLMAMMACVALFVFLLIIMKCFKKHNIIGSFFSLIAFVTDVFIIFIYREGLIPILDFVIVKVLKRRTDFTSRKEIWERATNSIKDKLLFGYGYGKGVAPKVNSKIEVHPHNDMLNRLLVGGLVFLIIFIFVNYLLNRRIDKQKNSIIKILVISILFGVYLTFITEAYTNVYLYYIIFFLAYHVNSFSEKEE